MTIELSRRVKFPTRSYTNHGVSPLRHNSSLTSSRSHLLLLYHKWNHVCSFSTLITHRITHLVDIVPPDTVTRSFKTNRNIFGLIKSYNSTHPPTHDPDQQLSLEDLNDHAIDVEPPPTVTSVQFPTFHPYPNESSFLLGDWYWNHGTQKSQGSFTQLVDIITGVDFKMEDVRHTSWSTVNKRLGETLFDENAGEWEDMDAGWMKTRVSMNVPFHSRMKDKGGARPHIIGDLYHRSITAIIKEKLANSSDAELFHYEPYRLSWVPTLDSDEIHIHGELYTSSSFIDTHRELQESSREPGCTLPRMVIALMLWSDATHLTSFGNAKLWPLYLYFGNESKYRRCKPSCHLANHVAYFQTVWMVILSPAPALIFF